MKHYIMTLSTQNNLIWNIYLAFFPVRAKIVHFCRMASYKMRSTEVWLKLDWSSQTWSKKLSTMVKSLIFVWKSSSFDMIPSIFNKEIAEVSLETPKFDWGHRIFQFIISSNNRPKSRAFWMQINNTYMANEWLQLHKRAQTWQINHSFCIQIFLNAKRFTILPCKSNKRTHSI